MLARESFDRELGQLEAEVILLGGMVENAIFEALAALKDRDLARSQALIDNDDEIDEKEWSIERGCIRLLRREAPLARDLRRIITILELANELEHWQAQPDDGRRTAAQGTDRHSGDGRDRRQHGQAEPRSVPRKGPGQGRRDRSDPRT